MRAEDTKKLCTRLFRQRGIWITSLSHFIDLVPRLAEQSHDVIGPNRSSERARVIVETTKQPEFKIIHSGQKAEA
jgi:hypothetical protein